jgi:hypothetical protein
MTGLFLQTAPPPVRSASAVLVAIATYSTESASRLVLAAWVGWVVPAFDDGRYDLSNPDDLEFIKDQIASDIRELADLSDSLQFDLEDGHLSLDDVRQRADEMLRVLMQMEEEMTEEDAWKWLNENLVATR